MFNEIIKLGAFIKRDFRILTTYKLAFSMVFLSIIFNFFYMVLFGSMFTSGGAPALNIYGGDYISYLLIGSIGWGFLWSIMNGTSISIRTEMEIGTLESILLTPTSIYTLMGAYTFLSAFFGLLSVIILVSTGFLLFGISVFAGASIYTVIVFVLSTLLMAGFGMILGGLTIWIKNIGEMAPLIQSIAMFFCGVYFPITVLPGILQDIAKFVPFYYSIEGLRLSLVPDVVASELNFYVIILLILSIAFVLVGAITLHFGLIKAKKDGSLSFY